MAPGRRVAVALAVGLVGAGVMLWATWDRAGVTGRDLRLILHAGTGSVAAGLAVAPLFGRPGRAGLGWAVLGALLATGLGGAVAGLLFDPMGAGVFRAALAGAAMGLILSLGSVPAVAFWAGGMVLVHALAGVRRPPSE